MQAHLGEALLKLEAETVDLVLSDLKMPGISGIELIKKIRERKTYVGIIIMAGHQTVYTEGDVRKVKADDYVSKPFELDSILAKVERVMFQVRNMQKLGE